MKSQNKAVLNCKEETPAEKWEKAGIGNDLIFAHVMSNQELFLGLMQRIFPELHLVSVKEHTIQKTEYGTLASKGVRFDVYSEIDGRCFDVEMQMQQEGDERKRTRYYQSMMDVQSLRAGNPYDELPDSYIVMIGRFDLFGHGRHIYRFKNIELHDHALELQDGTMKVFLSSTGTADDIPQDLKNFLKMVNGMAPADEFCRSIEREVQRIKQDAMVKEHFMDLEDKLRHERKRAREAGIQEGLNKGFSKGKQEGFCEGERCLLTLLKAMSASDEAPSSIDRVLTDDEYREQMYAKYNIK